MKQIEVFERIPNTPSDSPAVVFVHGACLGAWCWTDNFLDFFAEEGFHTFAPNLRGHGGSPISKPLNQVTIDDYVEDVASVIRQLPQPPIVVGHSMGGLIVQRLATQFTVEALVLMDPSPYAGMRSQKVRLLRAHPRAFLMASLTKDMHRIYRSNDNVRQIMFSPSTPEETITQCRLRLQKESWHATQEMNPPLKQPYAVNCPMLVVGGAEDGTVLPDAIRETARAYDATCKIFDSMGHNLMLEPAWQKVAIYILEWARQIE